MRKGYGATFLYNEAGQMLGVCTGADATSEHMQGMGPIASAICQDDPYVTGMTALRHPELAAMPRLIEANRIVRLGDRFSLLEARSSDCDGTEEVFLTFGSAAPQNYIKELQFVERGGQDPNLAGAWDSQRFSIRVRGARYCEQLRELAQLLVKGKVVLGGEFVWNMPTIGGVVLLVPERFDEVHLKEAESAQARFEQKLRARLSERPREERRRLRSA